MSVKAMAWAWDVTGLTTNEKFVLVALADHSDDRGRCWPGQDGLAAKCCLSRESVNRICKRLDGYGLMKIGHRLKDDGTRNSNLYTLNFDQSDAASHGSHVTLKGTKVTLRPTQSDAASHKPSENRQKENRQIARKRATPTPDHFSITEKLETWATEKRITADLESETEQFLDYHRARGSAFKCWESAWRTWMRNTLKFGRDRQDAENDYLEKLIAGEMH